jgi:uncharacterized protein (TIGR04141 family)
MPTIPHYRDLAQRDVTIYLLAESVTEEAVVAKLAAYREYPIQAGRTAARLFVKSNQSDEGPVWAALFENQVRPDAFGLVASVSGFMLIKVSERLFALTFGAGRFVLDDDWLEERFGFYTVLNLVDSDQIRSIDKRSLDAVGRQTRVQTSRGTTVREFGVDYERDLLRAVVGKPREEDLGMRVTGTSALRAAVRINLANLPRLLAKYLQESTSISYRRKFPGIDQLKPVFDERQIARLDRTVVEALNDRNIEAFSVGVPEIIDWQQVGVFRVEGLHDATDHRDLSLADIVRIGADVGLAWTANDLQRIRISVLDSEGIRQGRWSLRNCLFGQVTYQRKEWVLSSGTWYCVSNDLVADVNDAFSAVERLNGLPAFGNPSEAEYCTSLAAADAAWAVMDRDPVVFGGGRSSVEFCDLFNLQARTLLHVKRYAGSAPLSHLFQQALVSGETFKTVPEFRRLVNAKLPAAHKLDDCDRPPEGFRIALGIVRPGQLDLPFFAKVTLRNTVRLLTGFNFNVLLAHIDVREDWARAAVARRRVQAH